MLKFGLLGEKLGHSYSKDIHKIFFELANKNATYKMIEKKLEEIPQFIEELRTGKYNGINVTIPYKVEVIEYLDEVSPIAKKIGAVNTIKYENGKLIGDNTDYYGFLETLVKNDINVENKKILILGNGGAAKSIYNVLIDKNADRIFIATIQENNEIKLRINDRLIHYSEIKNIKNVDLIVNCTPVGMYPNIDMCPLTEENLIESENIIDLIYNPEETVLMMRYNKKNKKTVNGLFMLISQAIKSEEIWNNETYSIDIINQIYDKLSEKLYKIEENKTKEDKNISINKKI